MRARCASFAIAFLAAARPRLPLPLLRGAQRGRSRAAGGAIAAALCLALGALWIAPWPGGGPRLAAQQPPAAPSPPAGALGDPAALTAAPGPSAGEALLRWIPAAHADRHLVYVQPYGADGGFRPALGGDARTATIAGLTPGRSYSFVVVAGQQRPDGGVRWSRWSNWAAIWATIAAPTTRYNWFDSTGTVASPGSWAILGADGGVLTTWENLRGSAAALRVHRTDAWGTVEAGDLVEWRKADDCWIRYLVVGAPAPPAPGSSRREFPVERMTYAATGAGCTGAVGAGTGFSVDEDAPSVIPASAITSPVRHGPYLVYPSGWTGALEPQVFSGPPAPAAAGAGAAATATPHPSAYATDPAAARRLFPYWRDPVLPAGWAFMGAEGGVPNGPPYGHCATYRNAGGYYGAEICAYYNTHRPSRLTARQGDGEAVYEPRVIDGRAALVRYSPQGPAHDPDLSVIVRIFDAETGIEYEVWGYDPNLRGSNVAPVLAIARSLLPAAGAP